MDAVRAVAVPTSEVLDVVYRKLCPQTVNPLPPPNARYWGTITIDAGPHTGDILDRFDEILHHHPHIPSHVTELTLVEPNENAPNDAAAFVISRSSIFPLIAWSFDRLETLDMKGLDFTLLQDAPNLFLGLGRNRLNTLSLRKCRFTESLLLHLLSAVGYHLKELFMSNNFLVSSKTAVSVPAQLGAIGPPRFYFIIGSSDDEDILHIFGTPKLIASYFKVFCITTVLVSMDTLSMKTLYNLRRFIWTRGVDSISHLVIKAKAFGPLLIRGGSDLPRLALVMPTWIRILWVPLPLGDPSPGVVDWYIASIPKNDRYLDSLTLEVTLDFVFDDNGQRLVTSHATKGLWHRLDNHLASNTSVKRITLAGKLSALNIETDTVFWGKVGENEIAMKAEGYRILDEYYQNVLPRTCARAISTMTLFIESLQTRDTVTFAK